MIDWQHWHNEPLLIGGLVLVAWAYALAIGPFRERLSPGAAYPKGKAWSFYLGLVVFYLSVGSPLDQIGERFLLSAHMVQHMVIMYPAPLLVILGIPSWVIDPLLGQPRLKGLLRLLFHPLTCLLVPTIVVGVWHAPFLYEWTLENKVVHIAEHLMFFVVSLLFWWPLASPSLLFPSPSYATRMLYLFGTELAMIPVSAYLFFSHDILYPTYEYAPRLVASMSPLDDQMIAGIIMKIMGMAVSLLSLGVVFFKWYRTHEVRAKS